MQAPTYAPATDFSDEEEDAVGGRSTVRTTALDAELTSIATSVNALQANQELNQRDDGEIRDHRVKVHTLAADVLALLTIYGAAPRGNWVTSTAYALKDLVSESGNTYIATVAHTSGVFATDLAAQKWLLFTLGTAIGASAVTFAPTGTIAATDVQAAIAESDTENRALSAAVSAAVASLSAGLSDTSNAANGDALLGVKRTETGALATTQHAVNQQRVIYAMADAGCVADGTTDDRTALALADTMAGGTKQIYLSTGTYRVNSNITIASPLAFASNAILKPASGVVVTLTRPPSAPCEKIFDTSLGGEIRFTNATRVKADWWGAKADNSTDNTAAIQAAINSLEAPYPNGSGGIIEFTSGTYKIGNYIAIRNRVVLQGVGHLASEISASSSFSATRMFEFKNGTSSQFSCRIENMGIDCNDKSFSSGAVYAPSWNEHCGLRNVLIRKLGGGKGVFIDNFYGGSAQDLIDQVEVVGGASVAAGTIGVHLVADPTLTLGWNSMQIKHLSVTNAGSAANMVGLQCENRLLLNAEAIHFEAVYAGVALLTDASVVVERVQGGPSCGNIFDIASTWVGTLYAVGFKLGNAAKLLFDRRAASYTRFETDDLPQPLIFPPDPGQVLAAARCVNGSTTPSVSTGSGWAKRISGVSKNGTGSYRFTLSPGFGAATQFSGWAISHDSLFKVPSFVQQTATTFDVVFRDTAGNAVDTDDLTVYVTHKP